MVKIDEEKEHELMDLYDKLPKSYETIKILAKENEVSERTIYRILEKNNKTLPRDSKKKIEEQEWKNGAIDINTLAEMGSAITIEKKIQELIEATELESGVDIIKLANWIRLIKGRRPKFDWMRLLASGLVEVIRVMESDELYSDVMTIKKGYLPSLTLDSQDSTKKNSLVSMKEASKTALEITENKVQKVLLDKLLTLDDDEQDSDNYDDEYDRIEEIEAEERELTEKFMNTYQQITQMNKIPIPYNIISIRNMLVGQSRGELTRIFFRLTNLGQEKQKLLEKKEKEEEEKNFKLEAIQRKIQEAYEGEKELEK